MGRHNGAPGPVIILWQRAGPATGLPTRTEQADLRFVLHAAHGEFPRIAIAPGDVEECYRILSMLSTMQTIPGTRDSLADKFLASSYRSTDLFNGDGMKVDRGDMLQEEDIAKMGDYRRYNSQSWEYPLELSRAKRAEYSGQPGTSMMSRDTSQKRQS